MFLFLTIYGHAQAGAQAWGGQIFWHRPKIETIWSDELVCQNLQLYSKVKYYFTKIPH